MSGASDECCGFYDAFLLSRLSFFPFFHFTVSFSSLCYRISGVMRRRRRGGGGRMECCEGRQQNQRTKKESRTETHTSATTNITAATRFFFISFGHRLF